MTDKTGPTPAEGTDEGYHDSGAGGDAAPADGYHDSGVDDGREADATPADDTGGR